MAERNWWLPEASLRRDIEKQWVGGHPATIHPRDPRLDDVSIGTPPTASIATKQTPGAPFTPAEVRDVSTLGKSKMLKLQSANERRKLRNRQFRRALRKKLEELHRELQGLQGSLRPQDKQTQQVRILFMPGIDTQARIQASSDSSKARPNTFLGTHNEYWYPKSGCGVNGTLKVLSSGLAISLLVSPAAGCPDVETFVRLGQPIFGGAAGLSGFTILGLEADPKVPGTIRWLFFGSWCLFIGPFLYCMSSSVPRGKRASYVVATGIVTAFLVGVFSQMMTTTLDGISTWTPFISVASIVGVYLWYDKRHGTQRTHPPIGNTEDGNDTELRVSAFNRHQNRTSTAPEVVPDSITAATPAQTLAQTASGSSIQQSQYGEIDPTSLAENSPLMGGNDHERLPLPELGEASHAPRNLHELAVSGSAIPATHR